MKLLDTIFKDKQGNVVIWQTPNLPLTVWLVFLVAKKIAGEGHVATGFQFISSSFLLVWAWLEITSGKSIFRRVLGGIIMALMIIRAFTN